MLSVAPPLLRKRLEGDQTLVQTNADMSRDLSTARANRNRPVPESALRKYSVHHCHRVSSHFLLTVFA